MSNLKVWGEESVSQWVIFLLGGNSSHLQLQQDLLAGFLLLIPTVSSTEAHYISGTTVTIILLCNLVFLYTVITRYITLYSLNRLDLEVHPTHSALTYTFICCVFFFFLLMTFHSIEKHKKLETLSRKNTRLYNTKGLRLLSRKVSGYKVCFIFNTTARQCQ